MNIKSYLRGIGAGIIVAALVMGASNSRENRPVEEIDNSTLIESNAESSISGDNETSGNDVSPNDIKEDNLSSNDLKEEASLSSNDLKEEASLSSNDGAKEGSASLVNTEQTKADTSGDDLNKEDSEKTHINPMPEGENGYSNDGESITLTIVRGDSSVSVSRRLYEAGLVESAVEFDKYLCKEGYDKYICVGTFEIAPDSDYETIAKIITKKN